MFGFKFITTNIFCQKVEGRFSESQEKHCTIDSSCFHFFKTIMKTTIKELGIDELILIFHKLSWNDIINCCKTCQRWKYIAMNYFLKKQFSIFKKLNPDLEKYVIEEGLKEDQNCEDLILKAWEKFQPFKGNFFSDGLYTILSNINELEHHFLNIERTRTCSCFGDRT